MNPTEPMSFFDTVELPLLRDHEYLGEMFCSLAGKSNEHTNFEVFRRLPYTVEVFNLCLLRAEVMTQHLPHVDAELVWGSARFALEVNDRRMCDEPLSALRDGGYGIATAIPIDDRDDISGRITVSVASSQHMPTAQEDWKPPYWPKRPPLGALVKVTLEGAGRKRA